MNNELETSVDNNASFKELFQKGKDWVSFLKKQIWKLVIIGLIGGGIGLVYSILKKPNYNARITFVVEEGKAGSGLSGIAGQLGLDITTLAANGSGVSIFSGDNILLFLKSDFLCKQTLLTPYDSSKGLSLADKYAEVYELREKWAASKKINKEIFFPYKEGTQFSLLQDSLLQVITNRLIKKQLTVERIEKKTTFVGVIVNTEDRLLSQLFCERLVQNAVDRYIEIKTRRQKTNVERLQKRADSIEAVLNNKTYSSASEQEKVIDLNPASRTAAVRVEVTGRDKIMLGTVYGEVIKNLEVAKITLNQETPVVQIVDRPEQPLYANRTSKLISIIVGGILFGFIGLAVIIAIRVIKMKLE